MTNTPADEKDTTKKPKQKKPELSPKKQQDLAKALRANMMKRKEAQKKRKEDAAGSK